MLEAKPKAHYNPPMRAARQQVLGLIVIAILVLAVLLEGLFPGPPRSEDLRARLRQRNEERGAGYLHRVLHRLDPKAAAAIHANDVPKLIRAVEVCLSARERMTEMWKRGRDPLTGYRV